MSTKKEKELFDNLRGNILDCDPAYFIQNNLKLDGNDFRIIGNGWKFLVDMYRYIALQATQRTGKKVVIKKGRQVGATVMAAALDLYFTNSGLFPNFRVLHAFPALHFVKRFSQDKLEGMIRSAKNGFIEKNKLRTANAADNLTMKQFEKGTLWIDSIGEDADRIRGMTVDGIFFDECFPYDTYIETESGKIKIGKIYDYFISGNDLPLVKSYNESTESFEFKKIKNAWNRGEKDLLEIHFENRVVRCTENHKFLTSSGWTEAKNLTLDSIVLTSSKGFPEVAEHTSVNKISYLNKKEVVYDIEVEDNHNFVVTTSKTSKNLGGVIAHNCQDMYSQSISNATKILTAAKYGPIGEGMQVYFGTPKEKNSYFSILWEMSDQRFYHLGCKHCAQTFPFYLPGDNSWQTIWVSGYIIKCPLCGEVESKSEAIELGKWVPTKNSDDCKFVGFHINQLYIPYFTKENILNLMPENNPSENERTYQNEVLGEFFSGAGLPITKQEIYDLCRDPDRYFSKTIKDRRTYLGVDWGGKNDEKNAVAGQSYSCVVILSDIGNGVLQVEHAHKLKKQDFDYKKETIHEMYKRFGIKVGLSDWFFGQDVVFDLQKSYGERFLGAQGSGNLLKPLKFREDELIVSYNKDLMIEEIFDCFRKGKIRFPWKSYELLEWLIDHCTSMESSIKIVGGQQVKTYQKGTTPNDGLMALMYAYMAYKFDITKGFSEKPGFNKNNNTMPRPALAYVPRRM